MTLYSDQLSHDYSKNRDNYTATDAEVFSHLDRLGIKNKRILDFGCGDGTYSFDFIEKGAQSVIGIDVSPAMVQLANERLEKDRKENINFIEANGENLPFEDSSFDLVFANFVLHHFKDLQRPLKEIYRVLDSGGYLVATFSSYDILPEGRYLIDTEIPINLGKGDNKVTVHNLVKHYKNVEAEVRDVGFEIDTYKNIDNPNAAIDPSYPHLDKIKKLTILLITKKP